MAAGRISSGEFEIDGFGSTHWRLVISARQGADQTAALNRLCGAYWRLSRQAGRGGQAQDCRRDEGGNSHSYTLKCKFPRPLPNIFGRATPISWRVPSRRMAPALLRLFRLVKPWSRQCAQVKGASVGGVLTQPNLIVFRITSDANVRTDVSFEWDPCGQ